MRTKSIISPLIAEDELAGLRVVENIARGTARQLHPGELPGLHPLDEALPKGLKALSTLSRFVPEPLPAKAGPRKAGLAIYELGRPSRLL